MPPGTDLITGLHLRYKEARGRNFVTHQSAWKSVQECLLTNDPLLAFAAWYSTWLNGDMAFAQMYGVKETKLGLGMTVFEMEPFRVELFLFKPNAFIPNHSHPDVESYEVYVAGDMELTKDDIPQTIRTFVAPAITGVCFSNGGMIRIPAGSTHGGWINSPVNPRYCSGGCFMSIQYWKRNWEHQSVTFNWKGEEAHG